MIGADGPSNGANGGGLRRELVRLVSTCQARAFAENGHRAIDDCRAAFRGAIERAAARGELHPSGDVELIVDLLVAAVWSRRLVGHRPLQPVAAGAVVDAILYGIQARPAAGDREDDHGACRPRSG